MSECPVCRTAQVGRPETCDACGTPLRKSRVEPWIGLNLLIPGIIHLWRGWLVAGSAGVFGSLFAYGQLVSGGGLSGNWMVLGAWVLFWIPWALGWTWWAVGARRRYVSGNYVASVVVGILLIGNGVLFVGNLMVLSGLLML